MFAHWIESWKDSIFALIKADASLPHLLVVLVLVLVLARAIAEAAPVLAALILVLLWIDRDVLSPSAWWT